eukprot:TRINITY_DN20900_c0_g1_i1.p1 TRINITY_DN20900_c0_g1~~TRINITY_DN20900_c0_g1_i1.p1  ORF type:complete len:561 (+),score=100.87 TRINITY_DN20900_c0_g1_i1:64-1683(+)
MSPEEEIAQLRSELEREREKRKELEQQLMATSGTILKSPDEKDIFTNWRGSRKKVISKRACVVCGRDDQEGEERAKGFKCTPCVGLPSNPTFIRAVDANQELVKGRAEDGSFMVNNYIFQSHLGSGAFGKVRKVECRETGNSYAVKCLEKAKFESRVGNRFRRGTDPMKPVKEEIDIMKKLNHPNIIQIYGCMFSDEEIMILMEYLPGGQIWEPGQAAVPVRTLKRYIVGIANGLDYLHDLGIIHRDVKPENILLDKNGNVKLADFGVSAQISESSESTRVWGCVGTPIYMAPESIGQMCVNGTSADVWAFGVTIYQMAHAYHPWGDTSGTEMREAIQKSVIKFSHPDQDVNDLLQEMLDRDPQKRIRVNDIKRHALVRDVRTRKGHPVENISVDLNWDGSSVSACSRGRCNDPEGPSTFGNFFSSSAGPFTLVTGGDYELTIIDQSRDPRKRGLQGSIFSPFTPHHSIERPRRKLSVFRTENWDEDSLESHMRSRDGGSSQNSSRQGSFTSRDISPEFPSPAESEAATADNLTVAVGF